MNKFAIAASAALGAVAIATPTQAADFKWTVEYAGFFAEDASITGSFVADETAADDGIVFSDEFSSWIWSWSGNSEAEAFSIDSSDGFVETSFGPVGFYVDGTPNEVDLADDLDQGLYVSDSGDTGLDLEFLFVENFDTGAFALGDLAASGATISVSDPKPVPEPATILGVLTVLFGMGAAANRQKQVA
ncbi:MAG: PEP-CTERM sorting domain-containing protein [Cyanobacteria bacterium J06628_6]